MLLAVLAVVTLGALIIAGICWSYALDIASRPQAYSRRVRLWNLADMAMSLALWRNDRAADEIAMAALLHDVAEILIWHLAPLAALEIERRQAADPTLRSRVAQADVLGFELGALQEALARQGLEIETSASPEAFTAELKEESAAWAQVIKSAGIKAD